MSEQPVEDAKDKPTEPAERPPARPTIHHDHPRTEGETSVDDAWGAADDPA
ncbi:hypothetical protein GCM10009841_14700 [Microlunatus panaciterrae]|uniref:Uncharacterized protein n=1 Tax=Microlunatus panaciterrae TaxID=400768 RepID=A0ABS2RM02_9ACTN|nr:hypothetical protein [Microlunatus panaciterrae]MBM7800030.1 hypothetical protein [Microlunatus panaciterrae]